jgi:hypothetical protein
MTELVPAPVVDATTTSTTSTTTPPTTTTDGTTTDDTTPRCKTVQIQRHHPVVIRIDRLVKDNGKDATTNNNTHTVKTKPLPELLLLFGYQEWLCGFWLPGMQKKHPNLTLQLILQQQRHNKESNPNNNDNGNSTTTNTNSNDDTAAIGSSSSLILDIASTSSDMTPFATTSQVEWEKSLTKELKNLVVEDLGPLKAHKLWDTIPEQDDKDGRGRNDLARIEHELNVKVVFVRMPPDNDNDDEDHADKNNNYNKQKNDQDSFLSSRQHHHQYHDHVFLVGPKAKLAKKCFVLKNILAHYYWRLTGQEVKL